MRYLAGSWSLLVLRDADCAREDSKKENGGEITDFDEEKRLSDSSLRKQGKTVA